MFRKLAVAAIATTIAVSSFAADTFKVDKAHSQTSFKVRHFVSKVTGRFNDFDGVINLDRAKMQNSKVQFTIQTASIDTDNDSRDKHLRSADFFDAEKNPTITFTSTKITPAGKNRFNVKGNFTMHGITKQIVVPVTFNGFIKDPWGNERAGFDMTTTLNRKDYGIVWNKALDEGGYMLGDDVEINVSLETVKEKPAAPVTK